MEFKDNIEEKNIFNKEKNKTSNNEKENTQWKKKQKENNNTINDSKEINKIIQKTQKKQTKFLLKIKYWMTQISIFITELWIILPVIFGILIPMIYAIPLAYSSWILFFNTPFGDWVNGWLLIDNYPVLLIIVLSCELISFFIGMFLFFAGIYSLARDRLENHPITTSGIYSFIRHPQNLGLILILFSFSLYIPFERLNLSFTLFGQYISRDLGIRVGEILSWALFSVILVIISLFEERKMMKNYPQEYLAYQCTTGFFFPLLLRKNIKTAQKPKRIHYKNDKQLILTILLIVCSYILFLIGMFFLSKDLAEKGFLVWTR
ncbi:methyltransferase family protein [Candidatus Harpocratesius sp.]